MAAIGDEQGQQEKLKKVNPADWGSPEQWGQDGVPIGVASVLDPTEDAWEYAPPPPKNRYTLRLLLSDRGFEWGHRDPNDPQSLYYTCNLECRIVGGDFNEIPVFDTVRTSIPRGKNLSTMMGLLLFIGYKLPKTDLSPRGQAYIFQQLLKREPKCDAFVDWRASVQLPNGDWKNIFSSMDDFPDGKGGKSHLYRYRHTNGTVEEVRARARVVKWYKKGDTSTIPTAPAVVVQPGQAMPGLVPAAAPGVAPSPGALGLGEPQPTPAATAPVAGAPPQPTPGQLALEDL